jgi:hypothetical protein
LELTGDGDDGDGDGDGGYNCCACSDHSDSILSVLNPA